MKRYYMVDLVIKDTVFVDANNEQEAEELARDIFKKTKYYVHSNQKLSIKPCNKLYKIESSHMLPSWEEYYTESELIDKFWDYAVRDEMYDSDYWYSQYVTSVGTQEPLSKSKWLKHVWTLYPPKWFNLIEIQDVWEINILPVKD